MLALPSLLMAAPPASAQESKREQPQAATQRAPGVLHQALRTKLNLETLVIAASRPGTSYMGMAGDLEGAASASGGLRLLPVAADGGLANLQDLLFLRGIDLAIVPTNVLAHAKATNALGGALPQRVAYVSTLYSEGVNIVAGRDIAALDDLRGKKVAVPAGDGTAQFTASDIFKHLGIGIDSVQIDPAAAFDELRSGAIAAILLVGGKPLASVAALPRDGSLRLLSLPFQALPAEGYVPAVFLPDDYPALIPPGSMVETVGVGAVLMASKTSDEAARRIAKHAPALLEAIAALAVSQADPRWKDVNLGATLPGWSRVDAVEKWLSDAAARRKLEIKSTPEAPRQHKLAKPSGLSGSHTRKKLFDEFEAWARQSATAQAAPQ